VRMGNRGEEILFLSFFCIRPAFKKLVFGVAVLKLISGMERLGSLDLKLRSARYWHRLHLSIEHRIMMLVIHHVGQVW